MAAPVKTKTWTKYSTFVAAGDGPVPQAGQQPYLSDARLVFFRLKTTFLAAGWTIVSSCGYHDGAWYYGAADHWPDADSVRWKEADLKFGWIVLKNTNLHAVGNGFQVLIAMDHDRSATYYATMGFSCEGGFAGGSETVRPAATDEVLVLNDETWTGYGNFVQNMAINIWYTSDGTSFRVWWKSGTTDFYMWMFERLVDTPAWVDKPVLVIVSTVSALSPMYDQAIAGKSYFCQGSFVKQPAALTTESNQVGVLMDLAAVQQVDMGGRWPVFPISAVSASLLVRGYLGRLSDLWAVPLAMAFGDYMPSTGEKDFVVINTLLMPNDGTVIQHP